MRLALPPLTPTAASATLRPAVFIDKDGTLIQDVPYNVDPALIRFTPHAPDALRRLQAEGFLLIVISNQPGLALGLFDLPALQRLAGALTARLAAEEVRLDGFYVCPHAPAPAPVIGADANDAAGTSPLAGAHPRERRRAAEAAIRGCRCRKPAPGLLLEAARDLGVDLTRSWMVGDILDDIEAGWRAGCRTVHLDVGNETVWRRSPIRVPSHTTHDLLAAAEAILAASSGSRGRRAAMADSAGGAVRAA